MNRLIGRGIVSVLALSAFTSSFAENKSAYFNPLQSAVPSLSIAPDARGGGMGDIGAATSADLYSQYWNPSKYVNMDSKAGVALSYTPWLRKIVHDINLLYLAGYYKLDDRQAISASIRYFSYGEINLTSTPSPTGEIISDGTAKPYEMAIDAAYSRSLSEYWSAAVSMRFILSDLMNGVLDEDGYKSAKAVAADISATYRRPFAMDDRRNAVFSIGTNFSNIGGKISYDEGITKQYLPANWRLGFSYDYPIDAFNKIALALDFNKLLVPSTPAQSDYIEYGENGITPESQAAYNKAYSDYLEYGTMKSIFKSFGDAPGGFSEEMKEIMWSLGAEYSYNEMFMVRGGYFHESQMKGNRKYFSLGAGFKMRVFEIQAAYIIAAKSSKTCPIDRTLRFSLGFNFDGMKKLVEN